MDRAETNSQNGGGKTATGSASSRSTEADPTDVRPEESFKAAGRYLGELKAYFKHYLAVKADSFEVGLRRRMYIAGLAIVGLLLASGMLVSASVLLLVGLASAIGAAFDPPKPWIGQIIVGFGLIAGTLVSTMLVMRRASGVFRNRTVAKYERKHTQQRRRLGHDVVERAYETTDDQR